MVMSDIKVDVCIFAFDILYLNGQQLMQEQLNVRREVNLYFISFFCALLTVESESNFLFGTL